MTVTSQPGTEPADPEPTGPEPPVSLRERKKRATRLLLRRTAFELVAERGFARVTVEDIAATADVSPRTFFNYFPTKEAAFFGLHPDRVAELREAIVNTLPGESAFDAVRTVMTGVALGIIDDLSDLGGDPVDWLRLMKTARADPQLRAAQAAQMAQLERAVADGLVLRLEADPERDPYPGLLAAVAVATVRSGVIFWANSSGVVPLDQYVDLAFRAFKDGLPEHSALRHADWKLTGKGI